MGTYYSGSVGGGYPFTLYSTGSGYNGHRSSYGEDGEPVAYAAYTLVHDLWKNTNDANGQGGDAASGNAGGDGGNNRNTLRGGGAGGGGGSIILPDVPAESGSITIYSLNDTP
jgi:hypothetical protein